MDVFLTEEAAGELDDVPEVIRLRVRGLLSRLRNWPTVSGAKPLTGTLKGKCRIRTGDYRVQFRLDGERIIVEKIGHRDGFYET